MPTHIDDDGQSIRSTKNEKNKLGLLAQATLHGDGPPPEQAAMPPAAMPPAAMPPRLPEAPPVRHVVVHRRGVDTGKKLIENLTGGEEAVEKFKKKGPGGPG